MEKETKKTPLEEKIEALQVTHKDTSKEDLIAILAQSQVDSEKDVQELNDKLSDYESGKVKKIPNPKVKVGKTTYEITSPTARIKGKVFTADQIKKNEETVEVKGKNVKIADHLADIRSGILVPKS